MQAISSLYEPLRKFAAAVTGNMSQFTYGSPEEQLRTPFANFVVDFASSFGWQIECKGETPLPQRLGRPDFAVHHNQLLVGYVELKPAGTGADGNRY